MENFKNLQNITFVKNEKKICSTKTEIEIKLHRNIKIIQFKKAHHI